MATANTSRRLLWDQPVTSQALEEMDAAGLPPQGRSPAIDLQRRLGEAALRGFYAPSPRRGTVNIRYIAVLAASAVISWGIVFGAGALMSG